MAGCDGMSFRNVSRSAWTAIKHAASSYGISGGDSGQASLQSFSFAWTYNDAAKTLHIQCLESPALAYCSEINAHLRGKVGRIVVVADSQDGDAIIA